METPSQSGHETHHVVRAATSRGFELDQIQNAVRGIRYGEVRVIIQDGVVVQIERVEKQRLR